MKFSSILDDSWLNGAIPRRVRNMFQHRGVTTNNHAEVSIEHDDGKWCNAHKMNLGVQFWPYHSDHEKKGIFF